MASRRGKRGGDENVFQVESIVARRTLRDGRVEYLLKWKGCSENENSWEPENNLNCPELLDKFNEQYRKDEQMENGDIETNADAEEILGAARMNSEIFYLVKLRGSAEGVFVASRVASQKYPKLVIDFYEQRMVNNMP